MVAVFVPAPTVTVSPDPSTWTVTVLVCPSWISVTVHLVPTGMLSYVMDCVPVDRAGMSNGSPIRAPPQRTLIVTAPCCPAAGPVIVFCPINEPVWVNRALALTVVVSVASCARMSRWATALGADMFSDAAATQPIAPGATVPSGTQIWLKQTGQSAAVLQATANATVPQNNVYLYDGTNGVPDAGRCRRTRGRHGERSEDRPGA